MRAIRLTIGAAVAAVVVASTPVVAIASPTANAADASCPGNPIIGLDMRGDLDGDVVSDVVVGVPTERSSAGAVDLRLSRARATRLTRGSVVGFGRATAGDRFGAAVALGNDISGDGCSDLAIGAPGERGAGAVHVVIGGTDGPSRTEGLTVREPDPRGGDRFGAAVAMARHDLWVGAPGRAVAGHPGAGAVYHFAVQRVGTGLVARLVHVLTQASPGIAGAPEGGDHFGAALAAEMPRVLIGIPGEDIGGHRDAGMVQTLVGTASASGQSIASFADERALAQNSPGVPGAPEPGDHFGASLALEGFLGVIGVPGEDVGRRRDAGAVQLLKEALNPGDAVSHFAPAALALQGSQWNGLHIPGWPEAGDRFGTSVAVANGLLGQGEPDDIVVGAPGEDIAGRADTGSVSIFGVGGRCEECGMPGARVAYRGHGLPGPLRAGDAVGATVAGRAWERPTDGEYLLFDGDLVAGAPGSPVDGVDAVGETLLPSTALRPLADLRTGLRYGGVIGRGASQPGP